MKNLCLYLLPSTEKQMEKQLGIYWWEFLLSIKIKFGPFIQKVYCVINMLCWVFHQLSFSLWLYIISSVVDAIINNLIFSPTVTLGRWLWSGGYKIHFFFFSPKGEATGEWLPQLKTGASWYNILLVLLKSAIRMWRSDFYWQNLKNPEVEDWAPFLFTLAKWPWLVIQTFSFLFVRSG